MIWGILSQPPMSLRKTLLCSTFFQDFRAAAKAKVTSSIQNHECPVNCFKVGGAGVAFVFLSPFSLISFRGTGLIIATQLFRFLGRQYILCASSHASPTFRPNSGGGGPRWSSE